MKKLSIGYFLTELIIVILGVTIAFWLNTRAEANKEHQVLKGYYSELQADLKRDRAYLNAIIQQNTSKQERLTRAIQLYEKGVPNRDSIFKYSREIGNYSFFEPIDMTYQSMINSGDLKLIRDLDIKRKLVSLYSRYHNIDDLQKNHLQALDENFFPKYVYMIDYVTGDILLPLEEEIIIKNYFGFSHNELSTHIAYYQSALKKNAELDSLISKSLK